MRIIARYTFVVLATLSILALLWAFRGAIVAFLLSLFIAATIRPVIGWVVNKGVHSIAAQVLVVVVLLNAVALLLYAFGPALANDLDTLITQGVQEYDRLYLIWSSGSAWQQALAERLPASTTLIEAMAGQNGGQMLGTVLGLTQGFFGAISDAFLIFILSVYWSQDQNRFERLWLSLLPPQERIHARNAWRVTEDVVGQFIRSEVVQSVLVAAILAVGFRLVGLPYPTLTALMAAALWVVVWLVPNAGMVVIGGIVFAIGLLVDLPTALMGTALTVILLGVIEWWLEPRLFDRTRYSSVLTLILMIPLVSVYGVVGLLIAPPFAAALQTVGAEAIRYANRPRTTEHEIEGLRARYDEVRQLFENDNGETFPQEIGSILKRLRKLMGDAEGVVG
jgi:predicted PurR-regulated permease PerM